MKKVLTLAVAMMMVVTLAACGKSDNKEGLTVTVEVVDSYVPYFEDAAKEFMKDNSDIKVKVVKTKDAFKNTLDKLPTKKANASTLMMSPHDRIGDMVEKGLISPVDVDTDGINKKAASAIEYKDEKYMLPLSAESLVLFYNADTVKTAPTSLKSIPVDKWVAPWTDFYYSASLVQENKGYIFGDGNTNPKDLGLNSKEAVAAGTFVQSLYKSGNDLWTKMQEAEAAPNLAIDAFKAKKVDYVINGPWQMADFESAGINFKIAPIPGVDGGLASPMTGTKGLLLNAFKSGDEQEAAKKFLKFLNTDEYAEKWAKDTKEVSVNTSVQEGYAKGSNDAAIVEAYNAGDPMPNIQEMAEVWAPAADAFKQIATGTDAKKALDAAEKTIEAAIKE